MLVCAYIYTHVHILGDTEAVRCDLPTMLLAEVILLASNIELVLEFLQCDEQVVQRNSLGLRTPLGSTKIWIRSLSNLREAVEARHFFSLSRRSMKAILPPRRP
jgi:hypothetical protein